MSQTTESRPRLSLCMIVKNESQNLPRCLTSVRPYVDEIIVVDTGSEDGTPEIALQYGAKVSYFEWQNDFAAARNYSISQASGDWILVLDADEELIVKSEAFLEKLNSKSRVLAYVLPLTNVTDFSEKLTPAYLTRLFRNFSEIRYINRLHEVIRLPDKDINEESLSYLEEVEILHYSYYQEKSRQKEKSRYIPMLEAIWQEDGLNLRLLDCLAQMYQNNQQPEKAQECYVEAFDKLLPNLMEGLPPEEFYCIPSLMFNLGVRSLQQQDFETARLICQRGFEWCPNYPPLNYLAGATLRALGFPLGSTAYFQNCIQLGQENSYYKGEPFELSYMTTYPAYDLGCAYIDLKRPQEALAAFELALSFDANFTAAREKTDIIRQYLATQTSLL